MQKILQDNKTKGKQQPTYRQSIFIALSSLIWHIPTQIYLTGLNRFYFKIFASLLIKNSLQDKQSRCKASEPSFA